MKNKTKYLIMIGVCAVLCAVVVITNYTEYRQSMVQITEELYPPVRETYSREGVNLSDESDETDTININTATAEELAAFLPGIGAVKAESIVAYRDAIGGFKSVEELIEVSGIGEATLENIRSYCRISDG